MDNNIVRISLVATSFSAFFLFVILCLDKIARHKDPNFRKRLQQRRDKNLLEKLSLREILPEINDPRDQQALILHEIQKAEYLMGDGKFDRAVTHFANAIAICADPHKLVLALKDSLPPNAFDLLLKVLANSYGKRFSRLPDGRLAYHQHNRHSRSPYH